MRFLALSWSASFPVSAVFWASSASLSRTRGASGTLLSLHGPHPPSQPGSLWQLSESGFWGCELLAHPMPLHMPFPGPGVPSLTPPGLSPNAAASGEPSCSTALPSLCCLHTCAQALGHGRDRIRWVTGAWVCLPSWTEASGVGLRLPSSWTADSWSAPPGTPPCVNRPRSALREHIASQERKTRKKAEETGGQWNSSKERGLN